MVNEGRGRLFRRRDGKYLIYLPKDFVEDSMFPFKNWQSSPRKPDQYDSIPMLVNFDSDKKIMIVRAYPGKK
jgi:hypothetical protein